MALMCKHPELSHASFDSLIAMRSHLSNNMNNRLLTKMIEKATIDSSIQYHVDEVVCAERRRTCSKGNARRASPRWSNYEGLHPNQAPTIARGLQASSSAIQSYATTETPKSWTAAASAKLQLEHHPTPTRAHPSDKRLHW